MADRYDAVIVGAGHNGLVTAGYLAGAGLSVLVLERREVVGGSCVTEELFPGFRVSSCSYICHLLQRKVVDDLELSDHGLRIHTVDPYRFQPFPDGRYMLTWQDPERTREEVSRIDRADGKAYPAFYEFWRRAAGIIHRHFLSSPPTLEELIAECEGTGGRARAGPDAHGQPGRPGNRALPVRPCEGDVPGCRGCREPEGARERTRSGLQHGRSTHRARPSGYTARGAWVA